MRTIQITHQFPHINEVEPITEKDETCLEDIRKVLEKHNALSRFGLALLHSHFPIKDGEILLETSNEEARTLVIKPVKKSEVGTHIMKTIITFNGKEGLGCTPFCPTDPQGNHFGYKDHG